MELRHLKYFLAVTEEANFTRAADKVHVAQPGLSAQIRQLEDELGQRLLDRSKRTVRLTQVGAAVLPHARAALDAVQRAQRAADEFSGIMRGRVGVGMVMSLSVIDIAGLLSEFQRKHPSVTITLSEANSDDLIQGLLSGQLDAALIGLSTPPPPGIAAQIVADEPIVLAVRPDHPLARKINVSLEALSEHGIISLPRGTGIRSCIDRACQNAGITPNIVVEASNPAMLAEFAKRGLGAALLPRSAVAKPGTKELRAVPFKRPGLRGRIELAWKAEGPRIPAARELISFARRQLEVARKRAMR
jgi:DNA-binding transcriptional LysR family regulator